jgi:hypothetical protein
MLYDTPKTFEVESDMEVAMNALFLDENYERQDYHYKELFQPLYALEDATNY